MDITFTKDKILNLHFRGGYVWYSTGICPPRDGKLPLVEFLRSSVLRDADCVKLAGTSSNAKLILALDGTKRHGRLKSVKVATPQIVAVLGQNPDPRAVLRNLEHGTKTKLPPSLGGFHEVTPNDIASYKLVAAVNRGVDKISDADMYGMLQDHPASRSLSFITSLQKGEVARLLACIIDPRWFVDECDPDSTWMLHEALGLTKETQAGVSGNRSPGRHHKRCQLVLQCWKNSQLELAIRDRFELCLPQPVNDCDLPGWAPSDIIWRQWGQKLKLGVPDAKPGDPVMADLRASQRFIAFLRLTWISEIYRDSPATPDDGAPLFRPSDFFKNELESAAYEQHQLENGMI